MLDVLTIGESMVVFTPTMNGAMRYAHQFNRSFAGAESNVAIGLTRLGHSVGWISKVGNDELGSALLSFIRGEGVDTSQVQRSQSHATGLIFKEIRHADDVRIQYYRQFSAATMMHPDMLDERIFASAKFLHVTGITAGISETAFNTIMAAIEIGKRHGVKIVFDPNIRNYFIHTPKYIERLQQILQHTDIWIPNQAEATSILGVEDIEEQAKMALSMGIQTVIIKSSDSDTFYFTANEQGRVPRFSVKAVDSVGAGDAFAAGTISGFLDQLLLQDIVIRANAMGAFAVTAIGDITNLPDKQELAHFVQQEKSDNVLR
ncbi:sugar kinase [Lysinibacillus piscis]|uniref:2-dehydro-3-deoxygluconokinase n=1 Tax=Lysinibacillus piscis TaxID=2518931 RepID=A0ABQ5NPV4_9BACI|nr:sugar kinase [Lysinibacillus sp. KH24]GLC90359.1 2-dehydro-3-deoxygluconokinase [Lysinibacillus sp. KH24]